MFEVRWATPPAFTPPRPNWLSLKPKSSAPAANTISAASPNHVPTGIGIHLRWERTSKSELHRHLSLRNINTNETSVRSENLLAKYSPGSMARKSAQSPNRLPAIGFSLLIIANFMVYCSLSAPAILTAMTAQGNATASAKLRPKAVETQLPVLIPAPYEFLPVQLEVPRLIVIREFDLPRFSTNLAYPTTLSWRVASVRRGQYSTLTRPFASSSLSFFFFVIWPWCDGAIAFGLQISDARGRKITTFRTFAWAILRM